MSRIQRTRSRATQSIAEAIVAFDTAPRNRELSDNTRLYLRSRLLWAYRESELADAADALIEQAHRTRECPNRHWRDRLRDLGRLADEYREEAA